MGLIYFREAYSKFSARCGWRAYLGTTALCALIVWTCPQTWDWSYRLGPGKTATTVVLFLLAVVVLTTQAYNPFIYFIF